MTLNRWIHIESMQSGAVKYHLSLSAQSVTNFVQLVFTALCVSLGALLVQFRLKEEV